MHIPAFAILSILPLVAANAPAFTRTLSLVSSAVYTLADFLYSWDSSSGAEPLSTFIEAWSSVAETDLGDLGNAAGNLDRLNRNDAGNVILSFQDLTITVESLMYTLVIRAIDFREVGASSSVTDSLEGFIDPLYSVAGIVFHAMDTVACDLLGYASELQDDLYSTVSSATDVFNASVPEIPGLVTTCLTSSSISSITGIVVVASGSSGDASAGASASAGSSRASQSAVSTASSSGTAAFSSVVSGSDGLVSAAAGSGDASSSAGSDESITDTGHGGAGGAGGAASTTSSASTAADSSAGDSTASVTSGSGSSSASASTSSGNGASSVALGCGAVFVAAAALLV